MRRYLMEMKPKELSHVIAMVALFRPGLMKFIPIYIRRMHGEEVVSEWAKEGLIVVAKSKVDTERGNPKVLVDKITDQIERVKLVSSISVKREKEV